MNKFAMVTLVLATALSAVSYGKDKTISFDETCLVKADGQFNGQIVNGGQFFKLVSEYSQRHRTVYVTGKIYSAANSSRVYLQGARQFSKNSGLSNAQVDALTDGLPTVEFSCMKY